MSLAIVAILSLALLYLYLYLYGLIKNKIQQRKKQRREEQPVLPQEEASDEVNQAELSEDEINTDMSFHLKNAHDAELRNDYLTARVEYMACVDSLKRDKKAIPQLEFVKKEYSEFVRRDPIFNKMLPFFLDGVRQNQGILQSDITAKAEDMNWGELRNYNRPISKDDIRYVFYFAEEFGLLIRKKEGRSYRLYLPEQLKDVTEEVETEEVETEEKEEAKKTDITKYDLLNYITAHQASMKSETEFYRSGNYLLYIKQRCLSLFLMNSQFSFYPRHETPPSGIELFSCYQFPNSGTSHDFQAFKKLNLADKVPDFNKCHSNFYTTIKPDWEKVQSLMTEHHNNWKSLPINERLELIDKLQSLYDGKNNSQIYNQHFVFENQYLRQQFDRFLSAKDFNDWWEGDAMSVLKVGEKA